MTGSRDLNGCVTIPRNSLSLLISIQGIVTFNAVISVLAKTAKACLAGPLAEALSQLKWHWFWDRATPKPINDFSTYDAASRGPRGALAMLGKKRLWCANAVAQPMASIVLLTSSGTYPHSERFSSYLQSQPNPSSSKCRHTLLAYMLQRSQL